MADEMDKKAAAAAREVENRLVWLLNFLVIRVVAPGSGTTGAAESADKALDEYQSRFAAIPPDGPPV